MDQRLGTRALSPQPEAESERAGCSLGGQAARAAWLDWPDLCQRCALQTGTTSLAPPACDACICDRRLALEQRPPRRLAAAGRLALLHRGFVAVPLTRSLLSRCGRLLGSGAHGTVRIAQHVETRECEPPPSSQPLGTHPRQPPPKPAIPAAGRPRQPGRRRSSATD